MIKKIAIFAVILIILFLIHKLTAQISQTAKSGERVSRALDEVYKLEVKNKALKKQLVQISSPEYMEEEIRNKLGLSKKGETIVVIPADKLKLILGASSSAQIRLPNWLGWLKVFFK